jgi:hypothetical protein
MGLDGFPMRFGSAVTSLPYDSLPTEENIMSKLRLFEPALNDSFESMFKHMMAPMRMEAENGSLEMRIDVSEANGALQSAR